MTSDEQELRKIRNRRIKRVKRWLRPLPRRANLHRYPLLNRFSAFARRRSYLWSFRVRHAVPAIYAGCILTLMPLFGIQFVLTFVAALLLRANLPILAGLQLVSNPFTVLPIWFILYQIGRYFISVFGLEAPPLARYEVRVILDNFMHGEWGSNFERFATVFAVTSLGAVIVGLIFGLVLSVVYRIVASRSSASYALLQRRIRHSKNPPPGDSTPPEPDVDANEDPKV